MSEAMNYMADVFKPFYQELNKKVENKEFLEDKTGVKYVEIIAPRIAFDLNNAGDGYIDFENRKSPRKYIDKEKEWYLSEELKIDKVSDVEIWNKVCDANKEINSNYGYLVFGKGNFSQYAHAYSALWNHSDTRQAIIIYTRPSIHLEQNDMGGSDFICTNFQQFFIRNNKLYCVTSMRSNDCIFGTFNDVPWFVYVAKRMYNDLKSIVKYNNLELGEMTFIPNSFHCYERHFDLLAEIAK